MCYADVFKDGTGVVEFIYYDDMKYAIKHLDDTKFRSHEVIFWFYSYMAFVVSLCELVVVFCFVFLQFPSNSSIVLLISSE